MSNRVKKTLGWATFLLFMGTFYIIQKHYPDETRRVLASFGAFSLGRYIANVIDAILKIER